MPQLFGVCYTQIMSPAESTNETSLRDVAALLRWYVDMGVDETIGEAPVDRFAVAAEQKAKVQAAAPPARTLSRESQGYFPAAADSPRAPPAAEGAGLLSPDTSIADAKALAAKADSIEDLHTALAGFDGCPLKKTAKSLVLADGNPAAHVMLIGEAPGADEDRQGKPFVGRSGQLLDRILAAIGLDRTSEDPATSAFISNTIFWRPPGNRKPTTAETETCLPFILRAIELADPKIIVCLGATPMQRLCNTTEGILRTRGKWRSTQVNGREVPLMPTLHPAYLLRQPAQKALCWRDMLAVKAKLSELG